MPTPIAEAKDALSGESRAQRPENSGPSVGDAIMGIVALMLVGSVLLLVRLWDGAARALRKAWPG